ncbi:hypothetical protein [Parabacteroides sp.]
MAYPKVKITNSTKYVVEGKAIYCSAFCSDDPYIVDSGMAWESKSRGVCLLKRITATIKTPSGNIEATPYESSGTSYSQFAIIDLTNNQFAVTRVVNGSEDLPPEDYIEPTEQQK